MERIIKYLLSFLINIQKGRPNAPFVCLPSGDPCPGSACMLWKASWVNNDTVVGWFYATSEENHAYNIKIIGIVLGFLVWLAFLYLSFLGFKLYIRWRIVRRALRGWAHFE